MSSQLFELLRRRRFPSSSQRRQREGLRRGEEADCEASSQRHPIFAFVYAGAAASSCVAARSLLGARRGGARQYLTPLLYPSARRGVAPSIAWRCCSKVACRETAALASARSVGQHAKAIKRFSNRLVQIVCRWQMHLRR